MLTLKPSEQIVQLTSGAWFGAVSRPDLFALTNHGRVLQRAWNATPPDWIDVTPASEPESIDHSHELAKELERIRTKP